jgi:hypothetical protein
MKADPTLTFAQAYAKTQRAVTDPTLAYRDKATEAAQTDKRWITAKTLEAKKALIDEYYKVMYGGSAAAPKGAKFLGME